MKIDDATLDALEWGEVCARVAERTSAEAAAAALAEWRPFESVEEARTALGEVEEAMRLLEQDVGVPVPFVEDQSRTVRALGVAGSVIEGPGLVSAARTLRGTRKWAAFLRRGEDAWPGLAARFRSAPAEPELEKRILDSFDPEARLLDGASRDLARLRTAVRTHRRELVDFLNGVISRLSSSVVSADSRPTIREGRYVVPLRREALSEVPGIVHDESGSGTTIFVEPHDAIEKNNGLRRSELAVRREEERILEELTGALADRRGELETAARLALHAETILARARYALDVDGRAPILGGDEIRIGQARHPLLVDRWGLDQVVPLDLELDPWERTLVVTGPNTGGKTVMLKTVGTVTLMAQSGIVPPVGEGTALPWHESVFADIGDEQSITEDLSTFTAHLTRLKAAYDEADDRSLVLVDEIGGSTDPSEGAALAAALIEEWTGRGVRTVVTTHYHMLEALAAESEGIVNGSLAYDIERNLPRYRFVKGVPGRSFGLELAERWGFGVVVERAREHLDEGIRKLDEMVDRLAAEEKAYAQARQALEDERRAVVDAETSRAREMAREAAERREAAEKRLGELEDQLEGLRREVRRQQRKLKERAVELAEAEAAAQQSRALAEEAERAAEALREERESLAETREMPPVEVGDRVRIPRYDLVGDVVELSRADDECTVRSGQVRISCRASEIEIVEKAADREPEERAPVEEESPPPMDDSAPPLEIDLRGMRAHEVGFPVAGAIERAWHTGRPTIRIIHGKGTGVLRREVAEILEKHPYVQEFRIGRWNEGGEGVTIASLEAEDERQEA